MTNRAQNLSLTAALLLPLLSACSKESGTQAAGPSMPTTKEMGDKAKEMGAQVAAQFHELKRTAESKLAGLEPTIADLKTKAQAGTEEVRTDLEDMVRQLEAKKIEVQKALADYDVKGAAKDSYEHLKTRIDAMMAEINKVVEKAKAK